MEYWKNRKETTYEKKDEPVVLTSGVLLYNFTKFYSSYPPKPIKPPLPLECLEK